MIKYIRKRTKGGIINCFVGDINLLTETTKNFINEKFEKYSIEILPKDVIIFYYLSNKEKMFNELQSEIKFSKSTLSDAIKRYEKKGLVKKSSCTCDKRKLYLSLTSKGEEMFEKIQIIDEEYENFIIDKIDCNELTNFQNILKKIVS